MGGSPPVPRSIGRESDMDESSNQFEFALYADGSSGHQGEASEASEPGRRKVQERVLSLVRAAGFDGLTMREGCAAISGHPDKGHQSVSSALSNLHREGRIVRLKKRRDGCGVYVAPEYGEGRTAVPHRSNKRAACPHCGGAL